jgi:hypothetical protein
MDSYAGRLQLSSQRTPSKPCAACGETILWQRRLATQWDKVVYCSASCRRVSVARARTGHDDRVEAYDPAESMASAA